MKESRNQKIIVFISILLAFVFLFVLAFSFVNLENIKFEKEQEFNQTITNINNSNYYYKNFTNSTTTESETPLFSNSLDAIITATNNLKTRENLYVYNFGTIITDAGLKVVVNSEQEIYRWSLTEKYYLLEKLQTAGINMGQTSASEFYIANGKTYKKSSTKVSASGSNLISDLSSSSWQETANEDTDILHYTFNKNTILNESDLVVYKNSNGKISHYVTEFNLSTTIGIQKYAEIIKNNTEGKAKSLPQFKTIKMRMEIDNSGNLTNLYIYEECSINVGLNATLTNQFNYIFKDMSEAPQIQKPNIS